jgi:hypothetical protein
MCYYPLVENNYFAIHFPTRTIGSQTLELVQALPIKLSTNATVAVTTIF